MECVVRSFIAPLEFMAEQLKRRKKIDFSKVKELQLGKKYFMKVLITNVIAVCSILTIIILTNEQLFTAVLNNTAAEANVMDVTYRIKINQMVSGL